jgi:hypothetical protein
MTSRSTSLGGNASFEPSTMKGKEKKRKEGKEREALCKKSQKCYISRSRGDETPGAISIEFGSLVNMVNVINFVKFDHCSFNGLNLARV